MIWLHSVSGALRLLQTETVLVPVLVLAGLTSTLLVGLGIVAYSQRQSRSYLLVVLALATLIIKTVLGGLVLVEVLSMDVHHVFEHVLDVMMALCLIASIYYARTAPSAMTEIND